MHSTSGISAAEGKTPVSLDLVQNYLDSLLRDVSLNLDEEVAPQAASVPVSTVTVAPVPVVTQQLLHVEVPDGAAAETPAHDATPLLAVALDPTAERVVPDWARQGFAGLMFEVAGLKMAAPLHALGGITVIEDRLQPVVGQADWFMGLLRWNGRNLRVIDTARFVMPERLETNAHRAAYQSVIVLGDSQWALAVDCADESVNLKADEVRWKQLTGTRPWLAGTLLQRLCALIDVDNLMSMLQKHELTTRDSLEPTGKI